MDDTPLPERCVLMLVKKYGNIAIARGQNSY